MCNQKRIITVFPVLCLMFLFFLQGCAGKAKTGQIGQEPSAPSPSATTDQMKDEPGRLEEEGRKLQEQGNYQKALECFNRAITLAPDRTSLVMARGLLHYQMKTYHLAFEDYNKAVKLDPNSAMNYLNRGDAYLVMAKHDLAMQDYKKTIQLDPKKHGAWYHMGMIKIMRGQFEEALKDTEKAISLLPENDEGYQFNKAFILYKLERYGEAKKAMEEVMKIAPDFDAAYKQMGDIYVETGDSKKALEYYDKAISLYDQNVEKINRREMNLYQKDIDKGMMYMNRAVANSNLEQYKETVADCENAIKSGFREASAYQEMAVARYEMGDYKQAAKDAEQCIKLIDYKQPGFKKYINAYTAYMVDGQYDKALEYNKKAIDEMTRVEPEHREIIIACYARARIYYNTGKYKEAMKSLEPVFKNTREAYINKKAEKLAAMIKSKLK